MSVDKVLDSDLYKIRHIIEADPAVATGFLLKAPEDSRSQLLALSFTLTTDANAANRFIYIRHARGTKHLYLGASTQAHPASTALIYTIAAYAPLFLNTTPGACGVSIPEYPALFEGDSLEVTIHHVQVGDQISDIVYAWKRWLIR